MASHDWSRPEIRKRCSFIFHELLFTLALLIYAKYEIDFQDNPTVCAVVQVIHITRRLMVNGSISWAHANTPWLHQGKQADYLIFPWKLKMNIAETLEYPLRDWLT